MTDELVCRRITVRGRVQGVGFRLFVLRRANALGLTGRVRNLPDGRSVEALAQGPLETVERFTDETMRQGPPGAFVAEMTVHEEPVDPARTTFTVDPTA